MKVSLIIFFALFVNYGVAQQLNVNYRTATDSTEKFHFLLFTNNSNGKLIYPVSNHGDAMIPQKREFNFIYTVLQDTILIQTTDLGSSNRTVNRLSKSKFLITSDGHLFDVVSGYTYVDDNRVSNKYDVYSIDGEIYKQKKAKTDYYGLVRKNYRPNKKLKRRIDDICLDSCKITILRGKKAFDKYGLNGINGVIEIESSK